ncbi:MAG: hypothetical protein OEV40_10575, partial [Acidimicrobiia bacterium]|nr:hypothetical protein [Acidimicrobiia bacterium]
AGAELQEAANIVAATNDPYALMLTIETAAEITAASPSSRISLLSAAAAMRSELGVVLTAPRAAELSGHVQRLRAGVDADSFNEAWDSGATTNPVDFLDLVKAVATTPAEATRDADESDGR